MTNQRQEFTHTFHFSCTNFANQKCRFRVEVEGIIQQREACVEEAWRKAQENADHRNLSNLSLLS